MDNTSIPEHLHQFWTGSTPGPQEVACLRSVRACHPNWRITIHGEDFSAPGWHTLQDLAEIQLIEFDDAALQCCFAACPSPALRSDVVRYLVLHRWGGVWLDFDVVCLKPLDPLARYPGFAGSESFGVIAAGAIGASRESPVIARALQLLPSFLDLADPLSIGPRLLTRAILDCGADWHILEPEVFYPWRWNLAGRPLRREDVRDSLAVHLNRSLGLADRESWDLLAELAPAFGKYDEVW